MSDSALSVTASCDLNIALEYLYLYLNLRYLYLDLLRKYLIQVCCGVNLHNLEYKSSATAEDGRPYESS